MLSRLSGWSLSEIKGLTQAELWEWLTEAVDIETELAPK